MRLPALLLCLLPALALAEDAPAKRTCRLLFLNPPAGAPSEIYLYDGSQAQKVEIPSMNFSDVHEIAAGAPAVRLLPGPVAAPEEVPATAPTAPLAAGLTDFYIVVTADPANKTLPVRMQIIDAGAGKFGKGRMMWYNLTENAVGGTLGSRKLALKGRSREVIEPPASGQEPFEVELHYQGPDGKPHPICQTQWLHDPRSRMLMFVYGGGNGTAPQVSGFKDFRIAEKE